MAIVPYVIIVLCGLGTMGLALGIKRFSPTTTKENDE